MICSFLVYDLLDQVFCSEWSVWISKSKGISYNNDLYGENTVVCTIPNRSSSPLRYAYSCICSGILCYICLLCSGVTHIYFPIFAVCLCFLFWWSFWAAINNDTVSYMRFPLHNHVRIDLSVILLISLLKYLYNYFVSYFWVLVFSGFLFILLFIVLQPLVDISSLSLLCFIYSLSSFIVQSTQSLMLIHPLPTCLLLNIVLKTFWLVFIFCFVLWCRVLSFSVVFLKNASQ